MNAIDRRSFLATAAAAGLATAAPAWAQPRDPKVAEQSKALTAFLDAQYEEEVQMDPEELTSQGRKEHYDRLSDRSEAQADRVLAWRKQSVAKMKAQFDPAKLDDAARTSFDMWALELERSQIRNKWRRHRYVFARGSAHTGLPNFLINFHRVDEPSDLKAYVTRIGLIGPALDQLLVRAKAGAAADGAAEAVVAALEEGSDAKILEGAAAHFGKAHLEHHLLGRTDRQQVDDLAGRIGLGQLDRAVRGDRARHDALEDDRIVGDPRADAVADRLRQLALQGNDVRPDDDVDHGDQPLRAIIKRQAGGPRLLAEQIERIVRQRQDVGDLRIADQRPGEGSVGPDHLALVDRNSDFAGMYAVGDADGARLRRGLRRSAERS